MRRLKDSELKIFGRRVRDLRTKVNLSQEEFAEKAELDRTYVSGIERGVRNPTLTTMTKLAAALRVPVRELLRDL